MVVLLLLCWYLPPIAAQQDAVFRSFAPLLAVKSTIQKYYVSEVDEQDLIDGAIRGMVNRLDPHSAYLAPDEFAVFKDRSSGNYVGIGVQWRYDADAGAMVVTSPTEFSPAFEAGVRVGDVFVEIAGKSVGELRPDEAADRLLGLEGSMAHFKVRRDPQSDPIAFAVKRARIPLRTVVGTGRAADGQWNYLLDAQHGIGYVRIREFWGNTLQQFDAAMAELISVPIRALVIDVRFNPGGDMEACVGIADRFVAEGRLISTRTRREVRGTLDAVRGDELPAVPVAVLVNQGSASGAEILAGVLQDHGLARIFGQRSFGKGSVQTVRPIDDGRRALRLTTAYYYLPNGRCVHRLDESSDDWGITPDEVIELEDTATMAVLQGFNKAGEVHAPELTAPPMSIDPQLARAIEWLQAQLAN